MPEYQISKTFVIFWLLLLILVSGYIRVDGVEQYYYNRDEVQDIQIASGVNLKEVLNFSFFETHPPLGHILRYYWLKISEEIWFQRSLALIFGLAMIPLYYLIGKKINSPFTGLCLATLLSFSSGLIVQSYLVRKYTIFLFLLSFAFYYYVDWRRDKNNRKLFYYFIFAVLASLTHLANIFAIFAIASYQVVELFIKKDFVSLKKWVVCNVIIGIISLITIYLWQDIMSPFSFAAFHQAYIEKKEFTFVDLIITALFYPDLVSRYILPTNDSFFFALPFVIFSWIFCKNSRHVTLIMGVAFLTGMLLVASGSYQFLATRRSLWIAPFVIIGIGVAVSESLEYISFYLTKKRAFYWLHIFTALLLFLGVMVYDKQARFSETNLIGGLTDYNVISKSELDDIKDRLGNFDDDHAIIMDRGIISIFSQDNPYYYFDKKLLNPDSFVITSFGKTHIVFATSYYGYEMLKNPDLINQLNNKNKLIFIKTPFSDDFVNAISKCENIAKEIIMFEHAELIVVSKSDFFLKFINLHGGNHGCVKI